MKNWPSLLVLLLLPLSLPAISVETCVLEPLGRAQKPIATWIDQDNWLAPENLRFGMRSADYFVPRIQIKSPVVPDAHRNAARPLDLDKIKAKDPLDQDQRSIEFLLGTRLYADGIVVLRDGELVSEQYWHGLARQDARLLLDATRPVLSMMGAIAVTQGKIKPDQSIIRLVPELSEQTELRKLSLQRLLEANSRYEWSAQELSDWRVAGGWHGGSDGHGMRRWLSQPDLWERKLVEAGRHTLDAGPDGDLLTWALAEAYQQPLAQVFCEHIYRRMRPENPAYWVTDVEGTALSNGLALSLRDFAQLGQMLIDVRGGANRGRLPAWFVETLSASGRKRKDNAPELAGLETGSDYRYGFVHLGGSPNRIAILGAFGNSLYVDFDRRLVIAIFASYPKTYSVGAQATAQQIWDAIRVATQPEKKATKTKK